MSKMICYLVYQHVTTFSVQQVLLLLQIWEIFTLEFIKLMNACLKNMIIKCMRFFTMKLLHLNSSSVCIRSSKCLLVLTTVQPTVQFLCKNNDCALGRCLTTTLSLTMATYSILSIIWVCQVPLQTGNSLSSDIHVLQITMNSTAFKLSILSSIHMSQYLM